MERGKPQRKLRSCVLPTSAGSRRRPPFGRLGRLGRFFRASTAARRFAGWLLRLLSLRTHSSDRPQPSKRNLLESTVRHLFRYYRRNGRRRGRALRVSLLSSWLPSLPPELRVGKFGSPPRLPHLQKWRILRRGRTPKGAPRDHRPERQGSSGRAPRRSEPPAYITGAYHLC